MRVSVILSTYNDPDRLELSLWGFSVQTHADFEIILADDGSKEETHERVQAIREATGLVIRHVWQEDQGFRKCRILNRAIAVANSTYLVFSDGDCIPRKDFVATHVRLAAPNRFVSGGRCNLPQRVSEEIGPTEVLDGCVFDTRWWLRRTGPSLRSFLKMGSGPRRGGLLDRLTPTRATWNGHNSSGWKRDLIAVNGFDDRLGYGGQDRELGERLVNYGVRPLQARHRAVVVHLDHARPYVDPSAIRWNDSVRRRTTGGPLWLSRWVRFSKGPNRTDFGIRQLPDCSSVGEMADRREEEVPVESSPGSGEALSPA